MNHGAIELITAGLRLSVISLCPGSDYPFPETRFRRWLKRAEDLFLTSIIWIIISPFLTLIILGIKLNGGGPVFFKQWRLGLNGRPFMMYKFRTMKVCEDGVLQFGQATRKDPRVSPFGAVLRRYSLDELPQLFNVLQGNMSLVGPRPHPVAMNAQYWDQIPEYKLRHLVKPGITGWAQVNGWRGETDTYEKIYQRTVCDLMYVRSWSVWWDLLIILETICKGFFDDNAY